MNKVQKKEWKSPKVINLNSYDTNNSTQSKPTGDGGLTNTYLTS